jgi:hypothetical protein
VLAVPIGGVFLTWRSRRRLPTMHSVAKEVQKEEKKKEKMGATEELS